MPVRVKRLHWSIGRWEAGITDVLKFPRWSHGQPALRIPVRGCCRTTERVDQQHSRHENVVRNAEPQALPKPSEPEAAFQQGHLIDTELHFMSYLSRSFPFSQKILWVWLKMKHVLKMYLASHRLLAQVVLICLVFWDCSVYQEPGKFTKCSVHVPLVYVFKAHLQNRC